MNVNKKDMNIEIPDMDFRELESIVNMGVKPKIVFISYLKRCFKELGFKNIFHDKNELIVIGVVGIILLLVSMVNLADANLQTLYKFTFIVSPILYLSVVVFSFYNSKEKGAFEIEMTCKYNVYQLAALRMFCFSVVSILINTFSIVIIGVLLKEVDVMRMIIVSITGLFMFSTVFLYSLIKFKWRLAKYLVVAAWLSINLILSRIDYGAYIQFLMKAPLYIHLVISIICGFLYVKNLTELINFRRKKGEI